MKEGRHIYLVGIGGIGMSGLARYFHNKGCVVSGYDRTSTPLTDRLIAEGISIVFEDSIKAIPSEFVNAHSKNPEDVLVIFTPAIPQDSSILNYFKENGYSLNKRSQVLGLISEGMFTIAVAGTHGKTTTSSMCAHILKSNGIDCAAFLGGITTNYNTNVLFGTSDVLVVEADEYDRSFLTLHPDIAIITSMDADHLDIYGDKSQLTESFRLFASQLKTGGKLIHKEGLELETGITYSASENAEIQAKNVRIENGDFYFDYDSPSAKIENIRLGIPGLHNIENSLAAIAAALQLEIPESKIKEALGSFAGVKRRFEYIVKTDRHIYIDDYAHHPEELRACIAAVKSLYPDKKLTAIFQPHLYSRTRDFADGFAEVLSMADELILLEIYPARELPIEGIDSALILNKTTCGNKRICGKEEAVKLIEQEKPELLLTVGAGDIDTLVEPLKNAMSHA